MKRTLDAFITRSTPAALASNKKPKYSLPSDLKSSTHPLYPFPIPHLPPEWQSEIAQSPSQPGKEIKCDDLDIIYYKPFISAPLADQIFHFLRAESPFYRVIYKINRGGVETTINTPRFTTVFGVDQTSKFTDDGALVDARTGKPVPTGKNGQYECQGRGPRPLPQCLQYLKNVTEAVTGHTFNFALVNYYADGKDSISPHSDDERFLGPNPAIASFSFGAKRDFILSHKDKSKGVENVKLELGSGDCVLMRGTTQGRWNHAVPKRAGAEAMKGRINITFRKALMKGGTENYYRYNVGSGPVWRWDEGEKKMVEWKKGEVQEDVDGEKNGGKDGEKEGTQGKGEGGEASEVAAGGKSRLRD